MNPAHGILNIDLILETVGDLFGVAHDEQVIWNFFRIGRTRPDAVTGEKLRFGLTRTVSIDAAVLFVEIARLFPAEVQ